MFARITQSARSFLPWPSNSQIKEESHRSVHFHPTHENAGDGSMVTTRSQEHDLEESSLVEGLDQIPKSKSTKRRVQDNTKENNEPPAKKKRLSFEEGADVKVVTPRRRTQSIIEPTAGALENQQEQTLPLRPYESHDDVSQVEQDSADQNEKDFPTPSSIVEEATKEVTRMESMKETSTAQMKPKRQKNAKRAKNAESPVVQVVPAKATHKRFGSEDSTTLETENAVPEPATGLPALQAEEFGESAADSDDDAPEAITAAAGQEQARAAAADAAKAQLK